MSERGVIIQGLDVLDVIGFIETKNKKFQAILLNDLEQIFEDYPVYKIYTSPDDTQEKVKLDKNSEEFRLMRKLFLDGFNNYTRSILRLIFGDVEHLIEK